MSQNNDSLSVSFTHDEVEMIRNGLDDYLSTLVKQWENACDKKGKAEIEYLNKRMHSIDVLNAKLSDIFYR